MILRDPQRMLLAIVVAVALFLDVNLAVQLWNQR